MPIAAGAAVRQLVCLCSVDTEKLLYELCVTLGFCLPPDDNKRLIASPPSTIDAFTDEVIRAEGLDPLTMSSNLGAQMREIVTSYFPTAGEVVVFGGPPGAGSPAD